MAYELHQFLAPIHLWKHLLTGSCTICTRTGRTACFCTDCTGVSLNTNNAATNVSTTQPMSLEQLQGLFTRAERQAAVARRNPVLPIGGQLLAPYVSNDVQRRLLALPGQAVAFFPGKVSAPQVDSRRASYINALLIQSRGQVQRVPCTRCRNARGRPVFPECRRVPGAFGGACGNCKWPDLAASCSVQDHLGPDVREVTGGQPQGIRQGDGRLLNIGSGEAGSGADNPINLDDDDEGGANNPIQL